MDKINLKQLEAFSAIVKNQSFSAAAKELFTSQSTISMHIHNLESSLNCTLFQRKSGVKPYLTPEGEKVFAEAEIILEHCKILSEFQFENSNIYIGASSVPGKYIIPKITTTFQKKFPQSRIKMYSGNSGDVYAFLEKRKISIGVVGEKKYTDKFNHKLLLKDRFVFITPNTEEYRQIKKMANPVQELLKKPFILREQESGTRQFFQDRLNQVNKTFDDLNIVAEYDDTENIKLAVSEGIGISILSILSIKKEVQKGEVLLFDLEKDGSYREIYLVTRKDYSPTSIEKSFIKFAEEKAKEYSETYL